MNSNLTLVNEFNKLKYIISGLKTREDAYIILEKYKSNPNCYNLMKSLINGKKFDNSLDSESMKKNIMEISTIKYREDAYEFISKLLLSTSDIAQIKTFTRIADMKIAKPQYISLKDIRQRNKDNISVKKCPHCGYKCSMSKDTTYTVCGYSSGSGYDWEGCGKDWCFKCGKMLCKNWEQDELYLPTNSFHDSKCCKKHAISNGYKYPEDYCRCNNIYVMRCNQIYDFQI